MPDLTRLAACSGEIVSPDICEPLPVAIHVAEEFITKTVEQKAKE